MSNNDSTDFVTPHEPVIPPSVNDREDIPSIFTPPIDFLHPSYPSEESYLLRLPAFDHQHGGLQHAVALTVSPSLPETHWVAIWQEQETAPPLICPAMVY